MLDCYFHTQTGERMKNHSFHWTLFCITTTIFLCLVVIARSNSACIVFYLFYHFHKERNKPRKLIAYNGIIGLLKMSENMKLD